MRKILFAFIFVFSVCFISCDEADSTDSLPSADYSEFIDNENIQIPDSADALTVFNLCYDYFGGYGEYAVNGVATHTETSNLINKPHSETITCNINRIKIYHTDNSSSGLTLSSFYVDFINEAQEILSYHYQWQYKNTNAWKNEKTSTFFKSSDWYKKSDSKTKTSWSITITR